MADGAPAKKRYFFMVAFVAMALGVVAGVVLGPKAEPFGILANLVIQALKTVAIPLLFLAIIEAILTAHFSGRGLRLMAGISLLNGSIAVTLALLVVNIFQPGRYLNLGKAAAANGPLNANTEIDWVKSISSMIPESIVAPFASGSALGVITLALLLGFALRKVSQDSDMKSSVQVVTGVIQLLLRAAIKLIGWLVYLVPLAVFGAVARAVGKNGLEVVSGLSVYVLACVGTMAMQIAITYQAWIALHPRVTLKRFWNAAKEPALYAFGINSSLATMPVTLTALEEMGVRDEAARLSACVGTNLNNDGILLYEVLAALLMAQAYGISLDPAQQLLVAVVSIAATLGVSGFPDAGIIALTLVMSSVGLPPEGLVVLLTVDWLIGRFRTVTNVLSDMTVAVGIDHFLPAEKTVTPS